MIVSHYYCRLVIFCLIGLLLSCSNQRGVIPIKDQSQSVYHTALPGDTLYTIAWRYDLDFRSLASANHLKPPYAIRSGQRVYLNAKASTVSATIPTQSQSPILTAPSNQKAASATRKPASAQSALGWRWPSEGKIINRFATQSGLNKGIDIEGKLGQPVVAAASGTVVYAGSGLLGYGQLIILKHNEQYLSAYGHNSRLLVKENDQVVRGQEIAQMGATGADRVKLHFEIRQEGKPVDPLNYLPTP